MLNAVYRLVAPRRFEVEFTNIDLRGKNVIVRPTHLSICNADQRYYQGKRADDILRKKLPMALIHEGIGQVVFDPEGEFESGERVVMIPNTPSEVPDEVIAENYRPDSKFRASGFDGFMQDVVDIRRDRIVRLPDGIDPCVAAFTEIVSVSVHALRRFDVFAHGQRRAVGIWGDGNHCIFSEQTGTSSPILRLPMTPFLWRIYRNISSLTMPSSAWEGREPRRRLTRLLTASIRKERFRFWVCRKTRWPSIRV